MLKKSEIKKLTKALNKELKIAGFQGIHFVALDNRKRYTNENNRQ